jgi:hypothetical protein
MTSDPCSVDDARLESGIVFCLEKCLVQDHLPIDCHALGVGQALANEPVLRQPVTDVFAVTGVRIVVGPGEVIESGALVVRDGIIEAVGARDRHSGRRDGLRT